MVVDEDRRIRRWRDWLIPRSVLGITALLLSFAIGASLSGVTLYSYYEYRLHATETKVNGYVNGFDQRFRTASDTIDAEKKNAQAAVQNELEPLRQFQAEGGTIGKLTEKVQKSVWFVQTQDESGNVSVGSAFVVESNDNTTYLVTSYTTVKASTRAPAPDIILTKGSDRIKAKLENWVEDRDLAVLSIPRGNMQKLEFVALNEQPRVGQRTFVVSGFGSAGTSMTQGFVIDTNGNSIQHDAAVGPSLQGGPLINSDGKVTGVASTQYAPFGFGSNNGVTFAVPIRATCDKLLRCPPGGNSGGEPGQR